MLLNGFSNLCFPSQQRLNPATCPEAEFVDGHYIAGIRHRHPQEIPGTAHRHDMMADRKIAGHPQEDVGIDLGGR